jgi:hypothetical protein
MFTEHDSNWNGTDEFLSSVDIVQACFPRFDLTTLSTTSVVESLRPPSATIM